MAQENRPTSETAPTLTRLRTSLPVTDLTQALAVFDSLDAREVGFIVPLAHVDDEEPTREQFREALTAGWLNAETFLDNVFVMREMAPRAWGLRAVR